MKYNSRSHLAQIIRIVTVSLCLMSGSALAVNDMLLDVGDISADNWSISNLQVNIVGLDESTVTLQATLSLLEIPGIGLLLQNATLSCGRATLALQHFICDEGQMQAERSLLGMQQFDIDIDYASDDFWEVRVKGLDFARGSLSARLRMRSYGWSIQGEGKRLSLAALPDILVQFVPADWKVSGNIDLKFSLSGQGLDLNKLLVDIHSKQFSYSNTAGLQVGEDLQLKAEIQASKKGTAWHASSSLSFTGGQLYSDPWYLDVAKNNLYLYLSGEWRPDRDRVQLQKVEFKLTDVVVAGGTATVALNPVQLIASEATFTSADVGLLYQMLVQPLLIGGSLDALQMSGQADGVLAMDALGWRKMALRLHGFDLEDEGGRFGFDDLNLDLVWSGNSIVTTSSLEWKSGHLFNIQLGPLDAQFTSSEDRLRLNAPVDIAMLDGYLHLRELNVGGLYAGLVGGYLSASLNDLQMSSLNAALGWPHMVGKLQGDIPRIDLVPGYLRLGGTLRVGLFGGEVMVQNLSIENPFDTAPLFEADLSLNNLDLGQLTQTFSFGRIEGGLEGEVKNLQLVDWAVERFDMSLRSSTRSYRKRRISQRAIDNLTSLGNGVSGNLSNTFLRFFKDFSYSQIALELSLAGDVARIGGIDLPGGGYYLVKGSLLPRIDVIGRNRTVAWKDLVQRIKDVQLEAAVVH